MLLHTVQQKINFTQSPIKDKIRELVMTDLHKRIL